MEQHFPMRAGRSDIVSDTVPRPTLPHFEQNDLSRNSHPFTQCSAHQDPLLHL